jgi:hypothetical protein
VCCWRCLATSIQATIYKTLIKPVIFYGSESWTLIKVNELKIFERKILTKFNGPSYVNGVRRITYNVELYKLFKEPNIVQSINISG